MNNQYNDLLFIADRALGRTFVEIRERTGLPLNVLEEMEGRYGPDIERARTALLDKILAYVFEDLKRQIALLDRCIENITERSERLVFHPAHAERAYSSIAQLTNTRSKMIRDVTSLLLSHEKKPLQQDLSFPHREVGLKILLSLL